MARAVRISHAHSPIRREMQSKFIKSAARSVHPVFKSLQSSIGRVASELAFSYNPDPFTQEKMLAWGIVDRLDVVWDVAWEVHIILFPACDT